MGLFDFFKSEKENSIIDLTDLKIISTDHIRYQNGKDVSGHNFDCWRGIRIQSNISGNKGYTVTVYNLDGNHPVWGNNVQMAPKQMKIVEQTNSNIKLRGFGTDLMGNSFADYGLTLSISKNNIDKVVLQMFDRNIEIEYFISELVKVTSGKTDNQRVTEEMKTDFSEGVRALNSGNNRSAIDFFKKALALELTKGYVNDEWQACCYYNIGSALKELGLYSEAIGNYKKVLEKDKANEGAYLGLSQCYYEQDTNDGFQNSISVLNTCIKYFPESDQAHYNKAVVYYVIKDMKNALDYFAKAKKLGNTESDYYIELIQSLY